MLTPIMCMSYLKEQPYLNNRDLAYPIPFHSQNASANLSGLSEKSSRNSKAKVFNFLMLPKPRQDKNL